MAIVNLTARTSTLSCPGCRAGLEESPEGLVCLTCARSYPSVAGISDLRLDSDRYLDLEAERAKAERLHSLEPATDLAGIAEAYYAMTDDVVDWRRDRFLWHIARAESRGEALMERLPRNGRILEVGCGTGGLLAAAAKARRSITGVDIASRWLIVARRRLTDHGLSVPLIAASAESLPWPDDSFDVVVADSLLEHLDEPSLALREWARVVRPGGRLLLWSPNRFTLTTDPHVGLWGLGWLPRAWVPGYLRLRRRNVWPPRTLSATEARRLARDAGFVDVEIDAPGVSGSWARSLSGAQRGAAAAYTAARGFSPTRRLLTAIGPLWELRARRGGEAA
jgi:SAM-dependent methyltransferase